MYLSYMTLDIRNASARQALRNCGDMHRNLMSAFPAEQVENSPRRDINLLYRLEQRNDAIRLLMSSSCPPDINVLEMHGYIMLPGGVKDISALEGAFYAGRVLRFELLAAPCKKKSGEQKNSRRVFLKQPEERAAWLIRQGEKYGFELMNVMEDAQNIAICGRRQNDAIHYDAVRFTGVLKITDGAAFWQAYQSGIGPGKAYGLGMLTVAAL